MKNAFLLIASLILVVTLQAHVAFAADLTVELSQNTVTVGETFTATLSVSSTQAINDIEAAISYPADMLSIQSVSTSGSFLSIWAEQPSYISTPGVVSFNGGVPSPGYTGKKGHVLKIIFSAKSSGNAHIGFLTGNVYADDGLGTNVISKRNDATASIIPKKVTTGEELASETPRSFPGIPNILSEEMPDEKAWYKAFPATFSWLTPPDITSVQISVGSKPDSTPSTLYTPPVSKKTISNFEDGTWYLHVRFKNSQGFGSTAHRRINIDSAPPTGLSVETVEDKNSKLKLLIKAEDALSGVATVSVSDGNQILVEQPFQGESTVEIPGISPGVHTLRVTVSDNAGNVTYKDTEIVAYATVPTVEPVPATITSSDRIFIKGVYIPNTPIHVVVATEDEGEIRYNLMSDSFGSFEMTIPIVSSSRNFTVWVEVRDASGSVVKSAIQTVRIRHTVLESTARFLDQIRQVAEAGPMPLITFGFSLLVVLTVIIGVILRAFSLIKRGEAEIHANSRRVFQILRKDVALLSNSIEKNYPRDKWTAENQETLTDLMNDLSEAEQYFEKEHTPKK